MLAPALGGASLLVFMTSMASFSAPYVFGGGFRVLTTQLYASKLNGEGGLVAVEAVVLALVSPPFLVPLHGKEGPPAYTGPSKGLAPAPPAPRGPGARRPRPGGGGGGCSPPRRPLSSVSCCSPPFPCCGCRSPGRPPGPRSFPRRFTPPSRTGGCSPTPSSCARCSTRCRW